MSAPQKGTFHLENSLTSLAQVALQETQATGYALFQRTADRADLLRLAALGTEIPSQALLEGRHRTLLVFRLGVDGMVAFSFTDHAASVQAEEPLRRLVEAIETIWAARQSDVRYLNIAARLSTLEAQLIDSKIADRAQGLLNGERQTDLLDSLVRHVNTVLRPSSAERALETMVKELEDEIEDRRVTGQAKALLQAAHSISEEQAYTRLRVQSRKSRRRLKEVALDVIAGSIVITNAA